MKEINPLSLKLLERIYRQSRHHQVRQRAHFLILAGQGVKVEELMKIFSVSYKTIYNWMNRWESRGVVGLYNQPGRGRKPTFNSEQESKIKEWAKEEPKQLKKVLQKVKEAWNLEVSKDTIKRILKRLKMSWHRMRRDVGGEPDPIEYKEKQAQLTMFKELESEGKIDLYYLDETGFCLIPCVPYAWQDIGKYVGISSRHSQRLNVLGIMNRKNHLETYVSVQSINSDVVIACIDAFFPVVDKPTVIVVDRASIHTSNSIFEKTEEWKERGITIFELPSYSW
jgi:transposase